MTKDDRPSEPFSTARQRPYRSIFWAVLLIGAGVILLLANAGILPEARLWQLWRLWPVLLILGGLDLIFARRWPLAGALLGALTIVGVVALLLSSSFLPAELADRPQVPGLAGLQGDTAVQHGSFSEPLGAARSAEVTLDLSAFPTTVEALSDSRNLVEAEIDYIGTARMEVTGTQDKHVTLESRGNVGLVPWNLGGRPYQWEVRLNPEVDLGLVVEASSGSSTLNLDGLRLRQLDFNASSGSLRATLPASAQDIRLNCSSGSSDLTLAPESDARMALHMSSGSTKVRVGQDSRLDLVLERASSGSLTLLVPQGAPVRVLVRDHSAGSVDLPRDFTKVEGSVRDKEGTWESPNFDSEGRQIVLRVNDMSSGNVRVEYIR